jgi:hypothetical protein
MVEANYEFERLPDTDGGLTQNLRRQEYWTMLSGATGQLYGSAFTWKFQKEWKSNLYVWSDSAELHEKSLCFEKMV